MDDQNELTIQKRLELRKRTSEQPSLTADDIEERLVTAEQKRLNHLNEKIERARQSGTQPQGVQAQQLKHDRSIRAQDIQRKLDEAEEARETALFAKREALSSSALKRIGALKRTEQERQVAEDRLRQQIDDRLKAAEQRRHPRVLSTAWTPETSHTESTSRKPELDMNIVADDVQYSSERSPQSPGLMRELERRLKDANMRRGQWISSVVRQNKVLDAARQSKLSLALTRAQRDKAAARARIQRAQTDASHRREDMLSDRREKAAARNEHVERTAKTVRAARQLQGWWRTTVDDVTHANGNTDEPYIQRTSSLTPTAAADEAMHRVHFSPLTQALSPERRGDVEESNGTVPSISLGGPAIPVPQRHPHLHKTEGSSRSTQRPKFNQTDVTSSPVRDGESEADRASRRALRSVTISSSSAHKLRVVNKAKRLLTGKHAQRATKLITDVLSGQCIPAGTSVDTRPSENNNSLSIVARQAVTSTSLEDFDINHCPYKTFGDLADVIQNREVLSTALLVVRISLKAYELLSSLLGSGGGGESDTASMQEDSHSYSQNSHDALASDASLRPNIAQSPRTLLASLLVTWFPGELLHHMQQNEDSMSPKASKQAQTERTLSENAAVMLTALQALLWAIRDHSKQGSATPQATPVAEYVEDDTSRTLKNRFKADNAVLHVQTLLSCTSLEPVDIQAMPRRTVLLLHRFLAFNATWCEYMDSFMEWKVGDGARLAQAIARPFRNLVLRLDQYEREIRETDGRDAGTHQLLGGVRRQLEQLNHHLVRLLGQKGAERWQADQINTMKKKKQIGELTQITTGVSSASSSRLVQGPAKTGQNMGEVNHTSNSKQSASVAASAATATSSGSASAEGSKTRSSPKNKSESVNTVEHSVPTAAKQAPRMGLIKQIMSNESLVHELLLDENFRYPDPTTPVDIILPTESDIKHVVGLEESQKIPQHDLNEALSGVVHLWALHCRGVQAELNHLDLSNDTLAESSPSDTRVQVLERAKTLAAKLQVSVVVGTAGEGSVHSTSLSSGKILSIQKRQWKDWRKAETSLGKPGIRQTHPSFWNEVLSIALVDKKSGIQVIESALSELRDAFLKFISHRQDMKQSVHERLDLDMYRRLWEANAFDYKVWLDIIELFGKLVITLEAPVRTKQTKEWMTSIRYLLPQMTNAMAPQASNSNTPSVQNTSILDAIQLTLVPCALAFFYHKLDFIRIDMANFHLSTLRPFLLQNGSGLDYEKRKFMDMVNRGENRITGLSKWFRTVISRMIREHQSIATSTIDVNTCWHILTFDSKISRLSVLRDGTVWMLTAQAPLNAIAAMASESSEAEAIIPVPASQENESLNNSSNTSNLTDVSNQSVTFLTETPFFQTTFTSSFGQMFYRISYPETFGLDAKRLTEAQNNLQRFALVSALGALIVQLARSKSGHEASNTSSDVTLPKIHSLSDVQEHVNAWLLDDTIVLHDIQSGAADAVAALRQTFGQSSQISSEERSQISTMIQNAASYKHPLFRLYHIRVFQLLRFSVAKEIKRRTPPGAELRNANENWFWSKGLEELGSEVKNAVAQVNKHDFDKLVQNIGSIILHSELVFGDTLYKQVLRQVADKDTALNNANSE